MNRVTESVLIFALGGGIGAFIASRVVKAKYERILQEEIDSVKKTYSNKGRSLTDLSNQETAAILKDYDELVQEYINESPSDQNGKEEPVDRPYFIPPEEYGEIDGYEEISLTYYQKDDTLTDELDHEVDDYIDSVGTEFKDILTSSYSPVVYVRNDSKRCDYEIALNVGSYGDILNERPYLQEY